MEQNHWRQLAEGVVGVRAHNTLQPSLAVGVEYGEKDDRVFDLYAALRFAMPLR
jgi:hypothetical protein